MVLESVMYGYMNSGQMGSKSDSKGDIQDHHTAHGTGSFRGRSSSRVIRIQQV